MDIKILDSWLRDYLDTKATPAKIAECLALCGPSIERITKHGKDFVYSIEVTTNRVDSASVYGIAREANAILPRFGIKAKLKSQIMNISKMSNNKSQIFAKKVNYLTTDVDSRLCPRFTAVLIRNVKIGESPEIIKARLESAEVRPINNVVDISNYIMLSLGQPVHAFDYDKIKKALPAGRQGKMILRESKKGEKITTLDKKTFTLAGGDIVIEDGDKRLIDLAGVMGGDLSAVDANTKNVLLFVQTYDPVRIRKTSMGLAQRTTAATIFEKGTDPELVTPAILEGIKLFEKLTSGVAEKEILNIYPNPYKTKVINTSLEFIDQRLGINVSKKEVSDILNSLEFQTNWTGNKIAVSVPSFRSNDVEIQEDIVEEVARIYGYHNMPSTLMGGVLPDPNPFLEQFLFESKVKNLLSGWGGVEVYTLSLVAKNYVNNGALKLKNPLGSDTEYLRTTLMPSLVSAANENVGNYDKFHLFEMANVYLPRRSQTKAGMDLPEERLMLAGVFYGEDRVSHGYDYRKAKGILEAFFEKLNIKTDYKIEESNGFGAGKALSVIVDSKSVGKFGVIENSNLLYYEFDVTKLCENQKLIQYKDIPKYPAQIEDLTLIFPEKTMIGEVINSVKTVNQLISKVDLKDIFKNSYTFHIEYQDPKKTLTDSEVEKIRNKILTEVKTKFGGTIKD